MKKPKAFNVDNVYEHETSPIDPILAEKQLICAIIERAIRDYLGFAGDISKNGKGNYQQACSDARAWLFSNKTYPFSCRWCFHQVNIDYDKSIKRIKNFYNNRTENKKISKNTSKLHDLLRVKKN